MTAGEFAPISLTALVSVCRSVDLGLVGVCERMLTPGVGLGMYPLAPSSHMTIQCGLLEKQNGINEDSLFLRADLRTILFSMLGSSAAILLS